jgi:hypothetical protein
MRFRILISMIASVCLGISGLANSAIITHNNYTLNPDTNIVTHTDGTEWLQWDVTKGKSIDIALTTFASQGWMLVSNAQMAGLFTDFGWGNFLYDNDFSSNVETYTADTDISTMDMFIELFGVTYNSCPNIKSPCFTQALFGSDLDSDGLYKFTEIISDYAGRRGGVYDDKAYVTPDRYDRHYILDYGGVALIRQIVVPEPSSVLIFALGLMGLASRRFMKQA